MKQISFMSGFHRSGSTLLTVLLNQHPDIYASHQSDLSSSLDMLQNGFGSFEGYMSGNSQHRYYQMLKEMPNSFYQDVEKPIVIDKSRGWGHPNTFKFMTMIDKDFKVIYCYRSILEVLASFVLLARKSPDTVFLKGFKEWGYSSLTYRPLEDALCDYFVLGTIEPTLYIMGTLKKDEYKSNVLFIDYKDLIEATQQTLDVTYSFLGAEPFKNNLTNIKDSEEPDDTFFGVDLHKVGDSIIKSKTNPAEILSPYVIQRYGNLLDGLI